MQPTVFIVDDESAARESLAALVQSLGYATATFASAEEFLAAKVDQQPGCLVTDLRMPGISGTELQELLRARGSTMPLVVLTAYADVPTAVKAVTSGAVTLLEKPCPAHELEKSIREALARDEQGRQRNQFRQRIQHCLSQLSAEERQVLDRMLAGVPNKVIAAELDCSLRTVEARRAAIFKKMESDSLATLARDMALAGDPPPTPEHP